MAYFSVVEAALKVPFAIRDMFSEADCLIFAIAETSRCFSSAISNANFAFYVACLAALISYGLTFLASFSLFGTYSGFY